jgi:hypothetical protein
MLLLLCVYCPVAGVDFLNEKGIGLLMSRIHIIGIFVPPVALGKLQGVGVFAFRY